MSENQVSRRIFIMSGAAVAMAGCANLQKTHTAGAGRRATPSLKRLGYKSPNEKLNVAAIGAGGKGGGDIEQCAGENVIALCDADWEKAAGSFRKFPNARKYKDFRDMLDKEPTIDACTISTPDHTHAVAAMACIKRGIHVYVQKPLTHTVYEARMLTEAAREYKVSTQMGNQGHSGDGVREMCEMIWDGAIGDVKEVHAWTNRPIWPQGILEAWKDGVPKPLPEEPVPDTMDWDAWIGPAPYRPYNSAYAPFNWRGWWDFGCGALGDMACHLLDPANWALRLTAPISIECVKQEQNNEQTFPTKSIIKYEFPRRGAMGPVAVYWYDGGLMPERPAGVDPNVQMGDGDNGSIFIGTKGILSTGTYGGGSRMIAGENMKDYKKPRPIIPRMPAGDDDYRQKIDWINACKGGPASGANFDYSGPFTEWVVLGNLALKFQGKLEWDAANMKVTNVKEANEWVKRPARKGWSL